MKLTLLGTGSPEVYARRASSGYLLEVGGDVIQIDCGGGSFDRLVKAGFHPRDLDALLISHLHSDHIMDYARLIHARWDGGGSSLPVFGPTPIAQVTERLFGKDGAFAVDLRARCEFGPSQEIWRERGGEMPRPWPSPEIHEIKAGFSRDFGAWRIQAVETPHAQPYLDSLGFRVDHGGRSLVYSGDSGPCQALADLARGADLMVHMCFGLSGENRSAAWTRGASGHREIAEMAHGAGVKKVALTHLRQHMDEEGVHEKILAEMAEIYSGEVVIGEDLMAFEI